MSLITILTEPAVLIITASFVFFILVVVKNYLKVANNLKYVSDFLAGLSKKELSYRFNELDSFMNSNNFTSTTWEDFKKALIYPEKIYAASQTPKATTNICLTIDASYFFNEDTLIFSKINHKFIQIIPTILTGLGPFFTFMKMAVAFSSVSFSVNAEVGNLLNDLISNIQIAAFCSVFAVGFSLLFMLIEKNLYSKMCKKYYLAIQKELIRLFDVVTSEKFLSDLVSESKTQNIRTEKLLQSLPDSLAEAVSSSLNKTTVPYMENILYSLNKLNESVSKNNGGGDIVDKLF